MDSVNEEVLESDLLTTPQVAAYLNLSRRTVEAYRRVGGGPPFLRLGGSGPANVVRYSRRALDAWVASQAQTDSTPCNRGHRIQGLHEGRAWVQDGQLHIERGLSGDCATDPSSDYSLWSFTKADVMAIFALGITLLTSPGEQ